MVLTCCVFDLVGRFLWRDFRRFCLSNGATQQFHSIIHPLRNSVESRRTRAANRNIVIKNFESRLVAPRGDLVRSGILEGNCRRIGVIAPDELLIVKFTENSTPCRKQLRSSTVMSTKQTLRDVRWVF